MGFETVIRVICSASFVRLDKVQVLVRSLRLQLLILSVLVRYKEDGLSAVALVGSFIGNRASTVLGAMVKTQITFDGYSLASVPQT